MATITVSIRPSLMSLVKASMDSGKLTEVIFRLLQKTNITDLSVSYAYELTCKSTLTLAVWSIVYPYPGPSVMLMSKF
jgi:hypothetical protein